VSPPGQYPGVQEVQVHVQVQVQVALSFNITILPLHIYLYLTRFDEIGEKTRTVRYSVDIAQSLSLPFYPMFVNIVKQQHGDMAEVVLEELLHQGSSFKESLLDICLVRLQSSIKDKHSVNMEILNSIFEVSFIIFSGFLV
jgi:hypothetical protein